MESDPGTRPYATTFKAPAVVAAHELLQKVIIWCNNNIQDTWDVIPPPALVEVAAVVVPILEARNPSK